MRKLILLGCLAMTAVSASAQSSTPYAVTTFAGSPGTGASGDGQGSGAYFNGPQAVVVDGSGNLYVADTKNNTVRMVTPSGYVTTLAGSAGSPGSTNGAAAAARFNQPDGIAVDPTGTNVYVTDTGNYLIRKISGGTVTTLAGSGSLGHADGTGTAASFAAPWGMAVDSLGNVFVSDAGANTIRKITAAGVVTTFAGTWASPHIVGHADGTGPAASFNQPAGIAIDSSNNLYVADTGNHTIRKITPDGVVSTLAGSPTYYGSNDGTGSGALFYLPIGVAADGAGNIYVADTGNSTIRRVTPKGVVTTLAGTPGIVGTSDGTGASAMFQNPYGVAVDSSGYVYVADTLNNTIRKAVSTLLLITTQPANQTAIAGGLATFSVSATSPTTMSYQWQFNGTNISGATASTYTVSNVQTANVGTYTVVVTNTGGSSVTSSGATLTIVAITAPTVSNPLSQTVNAGGTVVLSATATGGSINYQWYFDGQSIQGATSPYLVLTNVGTGQAGYYAIGANNQAGSAISGNSQLTVNSPAQPANAGQLINLSARANVGPGSGVLIGGFVVGGSGSKQFLLRGVGPGLTATFGLTGTLASPQLALYDSSPAPGPLVITTDSGWGNAPAAGSSPVSVAPTAAGPSVMTSVGAFALASGSADSAMLVTPPTGSYTAQISGPGSTTGIALAEIYDVSPGTTAPRLKNISARANVGVGGNILIGGFTITGNLPETVLIRGVGPGLTATFGLTGTLGAPQLALYDSVVPTNPQVIATNAGWGNAPVPGPSTVKAGIGQATASIMTGVGAFSLASGSADSSMLITLPPGSYTAQLTGVSGTTGIALVEIYEVP